MTTDDFEFRLYEATKTKYQNLLDNFKKDDDLIDQKFANVVPALWSDESTEIIAPPTAYDAVQNAADHLLTDPRITYPTRPVSEDSTKAQRTSESIQQFLQMAWNNIFSYCGDPLGRSKVPLVKGMVVLKKTINWDLLPELPDDPTPAQKAKFRREVEKAGRSSFLWNVEVLPKETVLPDIERPWDSGCMFEHYDITTREAKKRFGDLDVLKGRDPLSTLHYVEYWEKPIGSSKGKVIQWIERDRVYEGDNPYCWEHPLSTPEKPRYDGYIPYVVRDPGWGDMRAEAKPEDRYVSINTHQRSIVEAECRFLTEMHEYVKLYIFKPLVTKNVPEKTDLYMGPGAHWDLKDDQEAEFLQPGEMPVSLMQGLQRVNQYADQHSKFSTLGGQAQRGVDTATEADQNVRNAATKLNGPVRALRSAVIEINRQILQDIEKVLEVPVTIYGAASSGPSEVTVKPSDINGFYMTHVEMETSDEAAVMARQALMWANLAQRLSIPDTFVLKMAGVQNGTELRDEWLMEQMEKSPQTLQALLMMMLQGIGETGQMVNDSMRMQLMSPGAKAGATPAQATKQPDMPMDDVAAMRQQAQVDAVQNMPDRSLM